MKLKHLIPPVFAIVLFLTDCGTISKQEGLGSDVKTALASLSFDRKKPFTDIDVPTETVSLTTDKARAFTFSDGSSIDVPEDAFVGKDGKDVSGEVKLNYKSIKSPARILASGLHLLYKQGDSIVPFKTGGMFEVNAVSASGEPLKLKEGKSLTVNFAAIDQEAYSLYRFDEASKEWVQVGEANTFAKAPVLGSDETEEMGLLEPVAFDEDKDVVISVNVDHKKMKELAKYDKVIWKYTGEKSKAEVGQLLGKRWSSFELKKKNKAKGKYEISLNQDNTTEVVEVSPVFSKAAYARAMEAYKKSTVKEAAQTAVASSNRALSVINLGVYNLDVTEKANVMALNANVKFDKAEYDDNANLYKYFVVRNNGQTITRYDLSRSRLMVFSMNSDNKIIGLLPGNRLSVFTTADFKALNAKSSEEVTFKMKVLPDKIENEKQLDAIIARI